MLGMTGGETFFVLIAGIAGIAMTGIAWADAWAVRKGGPAKEEDE